MSKPRSEAVAYLDQSNFSRQLLEVAVIPSLRAILQPFPLAFKVAGQNRHSLFYKKLSNSIISLSLIGSSNSIISLSLIGFGSSNSIISLSLIGSSLIGSQTGIADCEVMDSR